MYNQETNMLDLMYPSMLAHSNVSKTECISIATGRGVEGIVFTSGKPISINDATSDARFNAYLDRQTGYHTHTMMCLPVLDAQGRAIACLSVSNKKKKRRDKVLCG